MQSVPSLHVATNTASPGSHNRQLSREKALMQSPTSKGSPKPTTVARVLRKLASEHPNESSPPHHSPVQHSVATGNVGGVSAKRTDSGGKVSPKATGGGQSANSQVIDAPVHSPTHANVSGAATHVNREDVQFREKVAWRSSKMGHVASAPSHSPLQPPKSLHHHDRHPDTRDKRFKEKALGLPRKQGAALGSRGGWGDWKDEIDNVVAEAPHDVMVEGAAVSKPVDQTIRYAKVGHKNVQHISGGGGGGVTHSPLMQSSGMPTTTSSAMSPSVSPRAWPTLAEAAKMDNDDMEFDSYRPNWSGRLEHPMAST